MNKARPRRGRGKTGCLKQVFHSLEEPLLELTSKGAILSANPAALALTGLTAKEVIARSFFDLFSWEDRLQIEALLGKHSCKRQAASLATLGRAQRLVEIHLLPDRCPGCRARLILLKDMACNAETAEIADNRIKAAEAESEKANQLLRREIANGVRFEQALLYRLQFEQLLSSISTDFIACRAGEIDVEIERILGKVGGFFLADRVYTFLFSEDGRRMSNTHEWCRVGVAAFRAVLQDLAVNDFSWLLRQLECGGVLAIPEVESLPPEAAAEKEHFQSQSIRSLILVPFCTNGRVLGFLGLDQVHRQRTWGEKDGHLLQLLASTMLQAMMRQQSQKQLEQSEFRYRTLFEQAADFIFVLEPDGTIADANQAACNEYGYTREELLGSSIRLLFPAGHQEEVTAGLQEIRRKSQSCFETVHRRRDGSAFPVGVSAKVLELAGRKYIYCIERDLTHRNRMEAELRESQEIFRQIAANLGSVLWMCDLEWRVLFVSQEFASLFGISPEHVRVIWDVMDYVHPEDRPFLLQYREHPPERDLELEYRVLLPDGSIQWQRTRGFPIRDESGRIFRYTGITENITEDHLLRERLKESELLHRTFFEANMDGIAILEEMKNPTGAIIGRVTACNHSFALLAGRSEEELLGLENLFAIQRQIEIAETVQPLPGQPHQLSGTFSWIRPDGRENYIEFRRLATIIGNRKFIYAVHRDITRQKMAEKRIRHLSRRIIQIGEEEQKRIARDLHDEFGKVLPQIRYGLEDLQRKLPEGKGKLRKIVRKLVSQYEEVGDLCRTIATRLRPDILDRLGLIAALRSCCEDFKTIHPEIEMDFQVCGRGGALSPDTEIVLYRLLQEGLTNIGKHARADRVRIMLTYSFPEVILTIRDNGSGLQGAQNGAAPGKAGGQGLFGMRERVSALDGRLAIAFQPGKGTTIRAILPARLENMNDDYDLIG